MKVFAAALLFLAIAPVRQEAARVAYTAEDGTEQVAEFKAGDFNWHPQPRTHSLKNVGTTKFEAIGIEWK